MKNLTEKEVGKIASEIGKGTYEHIKSMLIEKISHYEENTHVDIINILLTALCSVDCAILCMLSEIFKNFTGNEIDKEALMKVYLNGMVSALQENEKMKIISKNNISKLMN